MGSSLVGMDLDQKETIEFSGELKKWTNYILGWQSRYFVLRQGNLMYYKSEDDVRFGCRGAINLSNASLVAHKFDECRFDVHICDLIWYLRSECPEERKDWVDALTEHTRNARRNPWTYCLELREKLHDIKSLRDKLSEQAHNLVEDLEQTLAEAKNPKAVSFVKTDLNNFTDAVTELLSTMSACVDMIDQRGRHQETCDASISTDCPEMVEGRHCLMGDDEFFDAVESGLERIEEEAEMRKKLECGSAEKVASNETREKHWLWTRICQKTDEQIKMATSDLDESSWSLLLDEENLRMYSKEVEVDGLVTDPLKAVCTVKGVTGREICHYFFHPEYRQDWEPTVEQMDVIERIGQDVIVFHQVYKRVWPTAQRDTLFWSHLVRQPDSGKPDVWSVVNDSLELPQFPANDGKSVRVTFTACLHCFTETSSSAFLTRDDVTCRFTYCTVVNPGGWVPASAVRALRRKEYPKFLNKFASYVAEKTANKDILL